MWETLFYIDQWAVNKIFDPLIERLCRLVGKDNFWCARLWWKIMHGIFILWGISLILFAEQFFVGSVLMVSMGIMFAHASDLLWRLLCRWFKKRSIRHPYEKELSEIKYRIYVQGFNPLILAQARLRIYTMVTALCVMPIIGYSMIPLHRVYEIWLIAVAYNYAYLIYLYIRACMCGINVQSTVVG